jgi:hypothetical protein
LKIGGGCEARPRIPKWERMEKKKTSRRRRKIWAMDECKSGGNDKMQWERNDGGEWWLLVMVKGKIGNGRRFCNQAINE